MAGTLFGLALSQPVDLNGKPQVGCKLYVYQSGSFTIPVTSYKDYGLTEGQEHPFPIPSDAWGRLPIFWLEDGAYAFRLVDGDGEPLASSLNVPALGPSLGDDDEAQTVDENALFRTGDVLWLDVSGTRSGSVRDNGRTIGSATSGATERANLDCEALYLFLHQTFDNTLCPVTGGRGASAAADWAANKAIGLPDKRGRGPMGLDDMGNAAASRFPAQVPFTYGNSTTAGALGGQNAAALAQSELPAVAPAFTGIPMTTTVNIFVPAVGTVSSGGDASGITGPSTINTGTFTPAGTIAQLGSGTVMNKASMFVLGTFYRKL